jgi:hypothetical protein
VHCSPVLAIATLSATAVAMLSTATSAQTVPGGFVESASTAVVRPGVTPTLPARGKFTFPAPYNTVGARLTNASDCGGTDCVWYVGYSYWRNMNNHVGSNTMLIFLSLNRGKGGTGPTLFSYDKTTDAVTVLGPLFDASDPLSWATAEGWYWSATLPNALYLNQGTQFFRYDVMTRQKQLVFDAGPQYGAGTYIWQLHSSNDDRVHSGTLRDSATGASRGCFVYQEDTHAFSMFARQGDFDECQIDKSGRYLLIKDNVDGVAGEDNRIIDLQTGTSTLFLDQYGAAGHSDNGWGYMVAEDNYNPLPGAIRVWHFDQPFPTSESAGTDPQGLLVYHTTDWSADIGHLSHANARSGVPLDQQYACGANASRAKLPRNNEVVCFRLDSSLDVLVVAPVMTDLNAAGGGDDYAKAPKGNLDVTGQYFMWTSNVGGNRLDAFIVKVPSQLLIDGTSAGTGSGTGTTTTPPPSTTTGTFTDGFGRPDASSLGNGWSATGSIGISSGEAQPGTGSAVAVQPTYSGGTQNVQARFASIDNNLAPRFGVVLRYQDPKNYYTCYRLAGGSSRVRIARVQNGKETVLASAAIANPVRGKFFTLACSASGTTLSLEIDGVARASATDAAFSAGSVGLATKSAQRVDDFTSTVQ